MENLSPPGFLEQARLALFLGGMGTVGHEKEIRLSCQCIVNGDCTVEIQPKVIDWEGENFWQKPYPNK